MEERVIGVRKACVPQATASQVGLDKDSRTLPDCRLYEVRHGVRVVRHCARLSFCLELGGGFFCWMRNYHVWYETDSFRV